MTVPRSDRPYGSFPGPGSDAPEPAAAPPAPRPRLRTRIWRRLTAPLAVLLLVGLSWGLAGTVRDGAVRTLDAARAIETPEPTPPLGARVYAHVAPSVVQVIAHGASSEPSTGAGVIVDDQADILTSLHILEGATRITVRFHDGSEALARVVATLVEKDIAVLQPMTLPTQIVPATMGDPSRLAIGAPAFVIGHPFSLMSSFSGGVVSGLDRSLAVPGREKPITGLVQFDAAVNPGSSGGPLVDANGEVVGIVTGLVNPTGQRSFSGIGFAVTIDQAASALGLPPD